MISSVSDLKLFQIASLEPGSIAKVLDRDDIPFILRLADLEAGKNPRIMVLGGQHSYQVAEWSGVAIAELICAPDRLRFRLNSVDLGRGYNSPGALTVHVGGALISTAVPRNQFHSIPITVGSWKDDSSSLPHGEFKTYKDWELGSEDGRGNFSPIYHHK